ncbi:DUF3185 family protein [Melittangium boletus]|uniref:DUF3185 domain-containing protein n=1 Tax=Melittangium boletus DSM 14713 TaxID=1294270 RepID=A0A250IDU9_9BACT|nr:DUF3185 family protein [Melittangium boletus]ATB29390.1 hypothetical protein MEBOL_002839 [Melittangium boletus DSM 14713]
MGIVRILGLMLIVAGTVFLATAYRATDSFVERATQKVTGRYSDRTQRDLAIGGAGVVGGVLLLALGGGRRRR